MDTKDRRRARILILVVVVALLGLSTTWWLAGADERRVGGACDTWLEHRESLRTALAETEEAAGRAEAGGATTATEHFNDLDRTLAAMQDWEGVSPGVRGSLDSGDDASSLEQGAASAVGYVESGLTELRRLINEGEPAEVTIWLSEMSARFQGVDDACLAAARSRGR